MDGVNATRMDLIAAWRLLNRSQELAAQAKDKHAKTKSLKETLEQERELLGLNSKSVENQHSACKQQDNINIKLSELIGKLKSLQGGSASQTSESSTQGAIAYYRKETEIVISYRELPHVEGLVVRNKHLAETDRYAFEFIDGATFRIVDKWSGKSTTIWGDPHVDTSDQEGSYNGEFSDLKSSNTHTTLALEDGTQVTFTAKDNGVIEAVDIYKKSQHLVGFGLAYADLTQANRLFADKVDELTNSSDRIPLGDVVYAGGDGNDWFDSAGQMVWGKTTSKPVVTRPYSALEVNVTQTEESVFISSSIDQKG